MKEPNPPPEDPNEAAKAVVDKIIGKLDPKPKEIQVTITAKGDGYTKKNPPPEFD
jgi:hypothetical protein